MKLFKMKKFISIGALGFLFLLSCGNQDRNEEYQCTLFDKSGSYYLTIKNKTIEAQLSFLKFKNTYNIKEENSERILFGDDGNDGVPDKLRVDNTFYKKSLKLREYWVDEGKTYIHQCEKLN